MFDLVFNTSGKINVEKSNVRTNLARFNLQLRKLFLYGVTLLLDPKSQFVEGGAAGPSVVANPTNSGQWQHCKKFDGSSLSNNYEDNT